MLTCKNLEVLLQGMSVAAWQIFIGVQALHVNIH